MVAKRVAKLRAAPKATPEEKQAKLARAQAMKMITVQYQNFDVVWSKMAGFPWWPGIVFLDWETVKHAGITPTVIEPIPEPTETVVSMVSSHGKIEERTVVVKHCIVMFLDNGLSIQVANMQTDIQPFTSYYHANCNPNHKKAKSKTFKSALQRAMKLVHLVRFLCVIYPASRVVVLTLATVCMDVSKTGERLHSGRACAIENATTREAAASGAEDPATACG